MVPKKRGLLITVLVSILVLFPAAQPLAAKTPRSIVSHGSLDPLTLTKYIDPVRFPPVLVPDTTTYPGYDYYEVTMTQFTQTLHSELPPTTLWGYNGSFPGPTIEARSTLDPGGKPVKVLWTSELPTTTHLLPLDTTVHCGPGTVDCAPYVRTVVHLHGGHTDPESDGYPEAWFTPGFAERGPAWRTDVYTYRNDQPAATLWYHDHALGITRLNVYAGLAGFYILRDDLEDSLNLPRGRYEIPLVIQDRSFNTDGSLFYPSEPEDPSWPNPSIVPEFFGDTILVNGVVWPYVEVEPRKYRLRLLNGSNSRFYILRFGNLALYQIGNDGGLLQEPVPITQTLLAPAERADVIADFSGLPVGTRITVTNVGPDGPFTGLGADPPADPATTGQVMLLRVITPTLPDTSTLPATLRPIVPLDPADAAVTRTLSLVESEDEYGRLMLLLDGKMWDEAISEKPLLGTTEVWRIVNATPDTHPIHLHLVHFQVIDRQPFDVHTFTETGELIFTGPPVPPDPTEAGWKDTVRMNPGEVTRIIARFDILGTYVWHCHILEHEDYEMMRPFRVIGLVYLPAIPRHYNPRW